MGLALNKARSVILRGKCGQSIIAVLKAAVGDLDNVRRIVKLFVMVNGAPHFTEPHRVADVPTGIRVRWSASSGASIRAAPSVWHRFRLARASKLT